MKTVYTIALMAMSGEEESSLYSEMSKAMLNGTSNEQ
jgi:hypothetical protein